VNKPKFAKHNDGMAFVYREKRKQTDFNAKKNVSVLDDMDFVVKLAFEECSKREQDLEFANQNDFTLSMKIRTRYNADADNKCKVVINGYLYDVSYVDKTRTEMWLYLTGVKKLDS
jgi:SPP1 family predicted phage head-tail adaptor